MNGQKIIFVVGNSRSGTTMLGRILGRAPEAFTFNELHFFEQMWLPTLPAEGIEQEAAIDYMSRLMAVQRDGYFARLDADKYRSEATELIKTTNPGEWSAPRVYALFVAYEAGRHEKSIACDQTPRNVYFIGELLAYYPQAQIVHIIRDPRDVLLSQKNRWRRRSYASKTYPLRESIRNWVNYHPLSISLLWKSGINAWRKFENHPRVHSLRFEDLLEDPEQTIRQICERINVEYIPQMLEIPQIGSSHGVDHQDHLGVKKENAGRWQHAGNKDIADLSMCQSIVKREMVALNYPPEEFSINPLIYMWIAALWPIKNLLAVVLNAQKSRSLLDFIRRRLG